MPKETISRLPDDIVFAVCEQFMKGGRAVTVASSVSRPGLTINREQVYPIVAEGQRRGFLLLCPPLELDLAQRIADRYRKEAHAIHVPNVNSAKGPDDVAATAADVAIALIKALGRKKKAVHVGLGAGWTTMSIARRLALRLRAEADIPRLVLHALSAGFSVEEPRTTPVAFFSFFHDAGIPVEYVGLLAPAVVQPSEYARVKSLPGVREAFAAAQEIDIVITSLASATHEHGQLTQFMRLAPESGRELLEQAGWVGDVQCRPYSATGPITAKARIRAVTLFEIEELVRLASKRDKHVLLVAAPCGRCRTPKTGALRPLLESPELALWTKLVVDTTTARELVT